MNTLNKIYQLGVRKLVAVFTLGLFLVLVFFWIWNYLTTGVVIVKTDNPNNVVLIEHPESVGEGGEKVGGELIDSASGSLKVRLKAGTYNIRVVEAKTNSNARAVEVKARSSAEYTLNPKVLPTTEPVVPVESADFVTTDSGINYLSSNGQVFSVGTSGIPKAISEVRFKQIAWGNNGYGIGHDQAGRFYIVSKDKVRPLNPLERIHGQSAVSMSVADNNQAYVAINNNVYAVSPGEQAKKIYSSQIDAPSIFGSKSKLLLTRIVEHGHKGDEEERQETNVEVIDLDGNILASNSLYIGKAAWSPDENNIFITDLDGNSGFYDSGFNNFTTVPDARITDFVWGGSNDLYYIMSNQIKHFSLDEKISSVVVGWNPNSAFINLNLDRTGKFLYFASRSDGGVSIKRAGLTGQKSIPEVQAIDIVLPKSVGQCYLSYVNFGKPTIIVTYPGASKPDSCLIAAKDELNHFHISPDKFIFKKMPARE